MTKYINTENILKSIYTANELRFIKAQGWRLIPQTADVFAEHVKVSNHKYKEEWLPAKKELLTKGIVKRSKAVRKQMSEFFSVSYQVHSLEEWIKADDERIKQEAKAKREREAIDNMLKEDGLYGITDTLRHLRLGEHTGSMTARYSKTNGIEVHEDFDRYSGRCKYLKVTRSFTINIRRGWHVVLVGGLLTFVKDVNYSRKGVACEWIEQEREISKIRTVSGFLVRGEHIEAKTLKEAQAISAEHRAMQMARLLNQRKKNERRAEQKANGTLRITFQDSLNAGNCRPGTSEFKHKYEEAIGHRANDISIADLRKYGKLFGVEYYAEKAIEYALNH